MPVMTFVGSKITGSASTSTPVIASRPATRGRALGPDRGGVVGGVIGLPELDDEIELDGTSDEASCEFSGEVLGGELRRVVDGVNSGGRREREPERSPDSSVVDEEECVQAVVGEGGVTRGHRRHHCCLDRGK